MPQKKRQHFVPKFYLRNFACDSKQKSINLYNLKSGKCITNSSLRDQCYKDYFYGKDMRLENALATIDGATATILSAIINKGTVPKRTTTDHTTMKLFLLSQIVRTKHAEEEAHETATQLLRFVLSKNEKARNLLPGKVRLDDIGIKLKDPMNLLLSTAAQSLPLVMDLNYKVLFNATRVGFITSDNPAVKYNQLCEIKKIFRYNTGFAVKGLQIFLPVSEKYCLIFYDQETYRVGNRKDDIVSIADKQSINRINGLQVVNCYGNIYYGQSCSGADIYNLVRSYSPMRRKTKAGRKEYSSTDISGSSYVPRHFDNRVNLQINDIRVLTSAKASVVSNKIMPVRNKELIAVHDEFLKNVKKGTYKPTEWQKFLSDKALDPYRRA